MTAFIYHDAHRRITKILQPAGQGLVRNLTWRDGIALRLPGRRVLFVLGRAR